MASPLAEGGLKEERKKDILSLAILTFEKFYHPKSKICLITTRLCMGARVIYLLRV